MADMKTLTINGKKFIVADPDAATIDDSSVGSSAWSSHKINEEITRRQGGVEREAKGGDIISIEGASDDNLRGLKLFGKTTQFTTTGKNILPNRYTSGYQNGIQYDVNPDGSYHVYGTATANSQHYFSTTSPRTYDFTKTMVLSGGLPNIRVMFWIYNKDGTYIHAVNSETTAIREFNIPNGVTATCVLEVPSGATVDGVVYPQLEIGSTATAYEPYTGGIPSPNPDYPQPLNSVGGDGNVGVTVRGKNLIDPVNVVSAAAGGAYYHFITGLLSGSTSTPIKNIFLDAGTEYTLSFKYTGTESVGWLYLIGETQERISIGKHQTVFTFTPSVSEYYALYLWRSAASYEGEISDIQLESGITATTYEPYKEPQTLTAKTPNGLPGIPVSSGGNHIDENGQEWICDEIDFERGVYVQRIRKFTPKNLTKGYGGPKVYHAEYTTADYPAKPAKANGEKADIMCDSLPVKSSNDQHNYGGSSVVLSNTGIGYISFDGATTLTQVNAKLAEQDITVMYILATSIKRDLTAEQLAAYKALHTNKPNTTIYNDSGVDMEVVYTADTETWVEDQFEKRSRSNRLASAIVDTASGEVISVSDSSDDYMPGLKLYGKTTQFTTTGKNLLKLEVTPSSSTIITKNDDGSITVVNDSTTVRSGANGQLTGAIPAGTYNFHNISGNGAYIMKSASDYSMRVEVGQNRTFTYDGTGFLSIQYENIAGGVTTTFKAQLESGSTATEWEPYTGGKPAPNPDYPQELETVGADGNVAVTVCGKNLLKNASTEWISHGITFTKNEDGSVSYSGTNNDGNHAYYYGMGTMSYENSALFKAGTYIYSLNNPNFNTLVRIVNEDNTFSAIGDGTATNRFTLTEDCRIWVTCHLNNTVQGQSYSGVIYPMIRLDGTDATYEPYNAQTLTAQTPNGLPGIPVSSGGNYTDENGQQWVCDEIDFARGKYVQRIKTRVLNGSEGWGYNSAVNAPFTVSAPDIANCTRDEIQVLCDSYQPVPISASWVKYDTMVSRVSTIERALSFRNVNYATVYEFKASLADSPIKVQYILATPIETDLSAKQLAAFKPLHTNKPNTTIYNDSGAHMSTDYVADTKLYIDKKFAELAAAIVNNA